eukprot:TRINITY_DN6281_c0_g2_i2.p1 TRINITY_DN6281_c0_g2~~TRINITY_DN6281_c0_g2_i2.p1  ORF type:complete len:638 (+),score=-37.44 TRINITY_DN6281_c0_g2_i2:248-2161(+)
MEAPFLTQWISEQMMNAICWTLIHSLWIGLLVSLLAGGVIISTQRASSRLRYQLLCGCLLVFVGLMGFMFDQQLSTYHPIQLASYTPTLVTPALTSVLPQANRIGLMVVDVPLTGQLTTFINQQAGWIFAVWLLFFVVKSLKLASGLYYVHRIRSYKVYSVSDEWTHKLLSFCRTLGIQQSITLVQSELVKVPVTVGLLKPVILVPMGLLFQLPTEQIDTILWHELAHIQRRDYLVNLLQSLVETVFFFNPGLLWISSLIREERETCCDDIVLTHTSRKSNYLEALLAFQSYSDQPVAYAVALGFGNHQLMNRLKRMVSQENKRLSVVEKIVLLLGLILLSVSSFLAKPTSTPPKQTTLQRNAMTHVTRSSPPVKTRGTIAINPVKTTLPVSQKQVDAPWTISSSPVVSSKDTSRTFTSILFATSNQDMANRDMQVRDDKGNRYRLKIVDSQLVVLEVNGVTIQKEDWGNYKELLPQIDRAIAEKSRAKQEAITEFKAKTEREHQLQLNQLTEGQRAKASHIQQQVDKSVSGNPSKQWPDGIAKNKKKLPDLPDISQDQERVRGVIAALVQEKIVADLTAVDWFGLSDDELIVNGNRQSPLLHQKLKATYGIKPQYGLYYGPVKMVGTGVFMDKGDL